MDAARLIEQMKRDHRRVLSEMADLEASLAKPRASRPAFADGLRGVLAHLDRQFRTHMAAEDEILFPALVRALPASAGSVGPLHDEHAELRQMLKRLQATLGEPAGAARDEQIAVQVHDLADLLGIHIRKEESLVFGVAARLLTTEEIGAVLTRMNPKARAKDAPRPNPTRTRGEAR